MNYQFEAIEKDDQQTQKNHLTRDRNKARKRIQIITEFIISVCNANQNWFLEKAIQHVIKLEKLYLPLDVMTLLSQMHSTSMKSSPLYRMLYDYVKLRLKNENDDGLQDQSDWSIKEDLSCTCKDCGTLRIFLVSPTEKSLNWPMAKDRRRHMHDTIDVLELPLTHTTERKGSPHKLVLTKTTQLHTRAKKRFEQVQRALENLEDLHPIDAKSANCREQS